MADTKYVDPEGNELWTLEEAARQWGVSPRRVYKWIRGRTGSKGAYTRKSDGAVIRRYSNPRVRIDPTTYTMIKEGRTRKYLIRPQPYPSPIVEPFRRPTGEEVGQGFRTSTISYEAKKQNPQVDDSWLPQDQYQQVPDPFEDPFQSPTFFETQAPVVEKSEKKKKPPRGRKRSVEESTLESRGQQRAPKAAPASPETPPPPVSLAGPAEERANVLIGNLRAQLAEARGVGIRDIADGDITAAFRARAQREGTTARSWVERVVFPALLQPLMSDPEEAWTSDPRQVDAVRAALVNRLSTVGGGLSGARWTPPWGNIEGHDIF